VDLKDGLCPQGDGLGLGFRFGFKIQKQKKLFYMSNDNDARESFVSFHPCGLKFLLTIM